MSIISQVNFVSHRDGTDAGLAYAKQTARTYWEVATNPKHFGCQVNEFRFIRDLYELEKFLGPDSPVSKSEIDKLLEKPEKEDSDSDEMISIISDLLDLVSILRQTSPEMFNQDPHFEKIIDRANLFLNRE